jgi:hypothetical protein
MNVLKIYIFCVISFFLNKGSHYLWNLKKVTLEKLQNMTSALLLLICVVLRLEPESLCMLGKHPTTAPHP